MRAAAHNAANVTNKRKYGCLKLTMTERPTVYNSFSSEQVTESDGAKGQTGAGAARKEWLRGMDSNHDNQLQRLVSYQLDDPGIGQRSRAKSARAHDRINARSRCKPPSAHRTIA